MVKNTSSENPNSDDAASTGAGEPVEKPRRGLRRRITAAKSAATHVNAGAEIVLDTVQDAAPAPSKRAGGRKKKGEAEPEGAASTAPVESAAAKGALANPESLLAFERLAKDRAALNS